MQENLPKPSCKIGKSVVYYYRKSTCIGKERGAPLSFLLRKGVQMKITELVASFAEPVVKAHGCELWDVEYVREGSDYFLRI